MELRLSVWGVDLEPYCKYQHLRTRQSKRLSENSIQNHCILFRVIVMVLGMMV